MKNYIGIDLGDKLNAVCVLNELGDITEECTVENTTEAMSEYFSQFKGAKIAIEASSHLLWIHDLFLKLNHKVFVANPRKTALISANISKNDRNDARLLARLVRSDPKLLHPIKVRDVKTQEDLVLLKTRRALVEARGDLIRHIRGIIKPFGVTLPKTVTADNFHQEVAGYLPKSLLASLSDTTAIIKSLFLKIKSIDKKVEKLIEKKYPEALNLQTIPGIGPITSLTFVLIIGDPARFKKSRTVGAYFGMVPKQDQSGDTNKSLSITKAGDSAMRSLLVNCSHHILGAFGKDNQLRRHGLKIAGTEGNKIRKKKGVIAVSRKLATLMHSMLVSGKPFENTIVDTKDVS